MLFRHDELPPQYSWGGARNIARARPLPTNRAYKLGSFCRTPRYDATNE